MGNKLCAVPVHVKKKNSCIAPDWDLNIDLSLKGSGLSRHEIDIVIEFWNDFLEQEAFNRYSVFFISFFRLFIKVPKLQDLFYVGSKLLTMDQWEEYPLFMAHIRRIKTGLGIAISLLNDQYVCYEYLKTLACFHQSAGLKKSYIAAWMEILDDEIFNNFSELYTEKVRDTFRKWLIIMFEKLTVGLSR